MSPFLRAGLVLFVPTFLGMAVLVKLTHAGLVRLRGPDRRIVWPAALLPGLVCAAAAAGFGLWPVAADCVVSAVALGVLGRRLLPPPQFEV